MLDFFGDGQARLCCGKTRREFLQAGSLAAAGLALPQFLAAKEAGEVRPGCEDNACILIFNLGGPSQLDLWDMKPAAPRL